MCLHVWREGRQTPPLNPVCPSSTVFPLFTQKTAVLTASRNDSLPGKILFDAVKKKLRHQAKEGWIFFERWHMLRLRIVLVDSPLQQIINP